MKRHSTEGGLASSRLCLTVKNPRIVRASRLSGGKDRHSKVTTIRGLRDRRVRLSLPTAVQLYDLQDKLGLNQPSKVVDWLLNAAQHEIDKLPPLQVPPGGFIQFTKSMAISHEANPPQALSHPLTMKNNEIFSANAFDEDLSVAPKHTSWDSVVFLRAKQEEAAREWSAKKNIVQENEVDNQDVGIFRAPVSDNMSVNGPGHSSCPGVLNDAIACTSYSQSEHPNAYNSQFHSGSMPPSQFLMFGSQQATHSSSTLPLMFSSYTSGLTNFHTN